MAKLDENGLLYLWQRFKAIFVTKDELSNYGAGDMLKSTYDTDNNGKVDNADNADKFGGQLPEYYAKATDIPSDYAPEEHTHLQSEVVGLEDAIGTMTEIASGKCRAYVFNTVDDLDNWLTSEENTAKLITGDVFLIRAVDVPDYWWDGETNTKQVLETTKVDLTAITNAEIDAILAT